MAGRPVEIEALSAEERLDLLERLWDSLSGTPDAVSLTEEQRQELDRRDAELEEDIRQGRPLGIPWDEVLRQIRARS